MAEFGLRTPSQGNMSGGVEWYSGPSAGGYPGQGQLPTASSSYQYPGAAPAAYGAAYASTSFEDEPPLLEELGIDLSKIFLKTRAILFYRVNSKYLDDLDFGGALIFMLLLAGLHLLMGKYHFGVILGWSVVQSMVLYFVVNQLAGGDASSVDHPRLDLYSTCCVVGYCLVPLVLYSAVAILVPMGPPLLAFAFLATVWSANSAAAILVKRSPALSDQKALVIYPCLLLYSTFALLCVYSNATKAVKAA